MVVAQRNSDETNTYIYAQFRDKNPNECLVEINVRPTVFYPARPGINYITVRGLTLCHAATQWAPPTAEQVGLIGTHWSKGWIIENNVISDSRCSGVTLDDAVQKTKALLVNTHLLDQATISQLPYENFDGTPLKIETDYFGKQRSEVNPTAGPFEKPGPGELKLKVW